MGTEPHLYAVGTVLATIGLVVCDLRGWKLGRAVLKTCAATGFLLTAWAAGAFASAYGRWVFAALLFSWVGDVALLARESPKLFLVGLGSFLLGHVAYAVGFAVRGVDTTIALWALPVVAVLSGAFLRWLEPHVSARMRMPVFAYTAILSLMVVLAAGTVGAAGNGWILVGAVLFYASDGAVARERFVTSSIWNGAWGSPAYFFGQVVLALTVR